MSYFNLKNIKIRLNIILTGILEKLIKIKLTSSTLPSQNPREKLKIYKN